MGDPHINRCLDGGMSILLGSVDAKGRPSCCRGIAVTSADGCASVTVYVSMAVSQETIANIATTRRMAVVASHPIDHCSIQLKGTARTARLAREDEQPLVRSRLEQFGAILDTIGIPRSLTSCIAYWPAFAIDLDVDEIYEQTPGPRAGTRLR